MFITISIGGIIKKLVKGVATVIEKQNNEILYALRTPEISIPNMQEFPCGKVAANENIYLALERVIDEELDSKIETIKEIFNDNTHQYETFSLI